MWKGRFYLLCIVVCLVVQRIMSTPKSSINWEELEDSSGNKFSPRNAHATCVYNNKIYLVGGRCDKYMMYNLLDSYKMADVWSTSDGQIWVDEKYMIGDYWAQNNDVVQPGSIAPWYQRYGHTLDAIDQDGDGKHDFMIMLGGYAPNPSNDIWITKDGTNWVYCGLAPWSPRAWHFTVVFNGTLFVMGGTPLNNEVWRMDTVTPFNRTTPLTRSLYSNISYEIEWTRMSDAPWSPRVGAGLTAHTFWNMSAGENVTHARNRIVLAGGYGGWLEDSEIGIYDGFYTRADTWETYDGENWYLLNNNCSFGGRGWFGMDTLSDPNRTNPNVVGYKYLDFTIKPQKMYIFGGGYIGFSTSNIQIVSSMDGKADGYWSIDGITWVKINYEEGGGKSTVPFYSSQEWSETTVDTKIKYLGNWGLTLEKLTEPGGEQHFILIGGDFTGTGDFTSDTFRSREGIFCDIKGAICSGFGSCETWGCKCFEESGASGRYCEIGGRVIASDDDSKSAATVTVVSSVSSLILILLCSSWMIIM